MDMSYAIHMTLNDRASVFATVHRNLILTWDKKDITFLIVDHIFKQYLLLNVVEWKKTQDNY